ncbi:NUDIX hydrolase [Streptococcus danieliae]|uniref:8-oxo-dGTP diphosphatase n=1 Tax=Streptococcus danieliae TaxID=747656 RepID=A0A7Z0M6L2_9STRE|nr:NUDIX domain-containing protein [Streptococcus danieliae]MBF0699229.1 NUDIX domain-containing protein [Streptococcus danieliae]NYS96405.1 NUDIX domain-containing protein [Streptococcus danieliae]
MNCILFGLGLHAQRFYLEFLAKEEWIDKVIIVDSLTEKARLESLLSETSLHYELLLLDRFMGHSNILPAKDEQLVQEKITQYAIQKALISTDVPGYRPYLNFCLKNGIDVLCDRPIMNEYQETLDQWENSLTKMFEIQAPRRAHKGYQKIRELLSEVVREFQVPINKISISYSDGIWGLPSENFVRENAPSTSGYGKLMHSGYQLLDLLAFFMEINEENGFSYSKPSLLATDYRLNDFYRYFGKDFHEKLDIYEKDDSYDNLDLLKNLGPMDVSAIIDYKDQDENILTTARLEVAQSGLVRGAWIDLPEASSYENTRLKQEVVDISVGPLLTIKVLGYQISERAENNQTGGFDSFQIRVFRNSAIIGGKPVEVFDFEQAEAADFDQLRDYFLDKDSRSSLRQQKASLSLLSELERNRSQRFHQEHFRFAVELLIKYKGNYLLCKRSSTARIAPNIWNIPGGKVKYHEGIEEALIRECKEETNLDVLHFHYLDSIFINKAHQRIVYLYYAEVEDISDLTIDRSEFDDWAWVSAGDVDSYQSLNPHLVQWIKKLG